MIKTFFITLFIIFKLSSPLIADEQLCDWNNSSKIPCITISKVPNTSKINDKTINKTVISKQDILKSGSLDLKDILKQVPGLDVFQSGQYGQQTSLFTRGSESNHTLVLLNGIAINDQSVTDGLHDFGQDFLQTIQQIEIYKGANGAHFGPSAIAGAVNIVTDFDYNDSISIQGSDDQNNSFNFNKTVFTDNDWKINLKGANTKNKVLSSIAGGSEKDGSLNNQFNLNLEKFMSDNTKFNSVIYARRTQADYDGSVSDEIGYHSDNKMYALQSSIENRTSKKKNTIKMHYHNYNREYENSGYLDEYYSESIVGKIETREEINSNLSIGYGSEYKYDWGEFENRGSYTASTKGNLNNLGIYGNFGYKFGLDKVLSFHLRKDNHKTTDISNTHKVNYKQIFDNYSFSITNSTGLRNPTLYELYGTDNYGIKGNKFLEPEKSETNEISLEYIINDKYKYTTNFFQTKILNKIETNSAYTTYINEKKDIKQKGIENIFAFNKGSREYSIFTNFSKSRKSNGQAQSRRPDFSWGYNFSDKISNNFIKDLDLSLIFKHTGKYVDWDGSNNSYQKETNILDLKLSKSFFGNTIFFKMNNVLDEKYEKPATYSQEGRNLRMGFVKSY